MPVQMNRKELRAKLVHYQTKLVDDAQPAMLLVGMGVLTGLTNKCIDAIVENAHQISSPKDLLDIGVTSPEYCEPSIFAASCLISHRNKRTGTVSVNYYHYASEQYDMWVYYGCITLLSSTVLYTCSWIHLLTSM